MSVTDDVRTRLSGDTPATSAASRRSIVESARATTWRLLSSDNDRVMVVLVAVPFGLLFALTAGPLVAAIITSLMDWNLADPSGPRFVGLENYARLFTDSAFWGSVWRTVYQVGGTVAGQMVLGMLIALLLSRSFRGVGFLRSVYLVPMMMTPVVVGLLWRILFNTDRGVVNYLLSILGIDAINWLGDPSTAMPTVILADIWLSTPFVAVILLAGILSIPAEIYEAARIDGAGAFRTFSKITLPLLAPMIFLALLFRMMDAMKRFDSIYVMTGGGPGDSTETLELHAYFAAFEFLEIGYGSAIACVLLVLIFGVSTFLLRRVVRD